MARKLGVGVLVLVFVAGLLVFARSQSGGGNTKTELKIPFLSKSDPKVSAKDSMLQHANLARALDEMRTAGAGRVNSMRIDSGRADADVLAPSGRVETLEVRPGDDKAKKTDDSFRRPDRGETRPLDAVDSAAPERLAREGAARLHLAVTRLDYVTYDAEGLGGRYWVAFFKGGTRADGNRSGHVVKVYP